MHFCYANNVCFLFLLVSGKGCGLWLWHSLDFSLTFFCIPRLLCLCHVETLESLPVHSFNGVIISSVRGCTLQSPFVFLFLMILIYVCLICACLVLSVSFSFCCLGRVAVCDCGTPWTFFLLYFYFIFFFFFTFNHRSGCRSYDIFPVSLIQGHGELYYIFQRFCLTSWCLYDG